MLELICKKDGYQKQHCYHRVLVISSAWYDTLRFHAFSPYTARVAKYVGFVAQTTEGRLEVRHKAAARGGREGVDVYLVFTSGGSGPPSSTSLPRHRHRTRRYTQHTHTHTHTHTS